MFNYAGQADASLTDRSKGFSGNRVTALHQVTSLNGMNALSSGYQHNCSANEAGQAWCWGDGSTGALGTSTFPGDPYASLPLPVEFCHSSP